MINSSSHPKVGERATTASISVSETCNTQVYDNAILTQLTSSQFIQDAQHQLSSNFSQRGNLSTSIEKVMLLDKRHQTYQLTLSVSGMLIFHLSASQLQRLKMQIAGKKIRDAQRELLALVGVQGVYIQPSNQQDMNLPTDQNQITIHIMTGSIARSL
jgi:hypothetical protein